MNHSNGLNYLEGDFAELIKALAEIASRGPVPAIGTGDTAVGMTLLSLLGIPYSSVSKPAFKGISISARRGTKAKDINRVNLFAKVPDWTISQCKSSREIVERFGYDRDGGRKLYCTVRSRQANAQGLRLEIDRDAGRLNEVFDCKGQPSVPVAAWKLSVLEKKLAESHRASAWIVAVPSRRGEQELFHFRYATFTSSPRVSEFANLVDQGTVTMDHLIFLQGTQATEKGPLFKIKPENASALFPTKTSVDLLTL